MDSSLEKYKKDLDNLIVSGSDLLNAMQLECYPEEFENQVKNIFKTKQEIDEFKKKLPFFKEKYQQWYSESLAVIKFFLPDRASDFIRLYEKPKGRKEITYGNYVIEDYLQGLTITRFGDVVVGPDAAVPQVQQQFNILKSVEQRFKSSLFDIKQLLQADLFDSELEVAKELNKKGFVRGAGAVAGVVLEGHLLQVCNNHNLAVKKKNPGINDLAQILKNDDVIDTVIWRKIQYLADIRNLCDHKKKDNPKKDDIYNLIKGTDEIIETLF
jgi:hypothetical protein